MTAPKLFCDSIYIKGLEFTLESVAKPLASSAGCGASYVLLQGWTGWKQGVLSWLHCVVRKKGKACVHEAKGNAFNDSYNLVDVFTDNTEETKDR